MATRALPRTLDGSIVPRGRITKRITADFMWDTTLPSWLTVTAGTASFLGLDTSNGRVSVATDGTNGAAARIETTNGINLANVESILWELEGFCTDDVGTGINLTGGIGSAANVAGAQFTQVGNSTEMIKAGPQNGTLITPSGQTPNAINLGEGNRNKNLGFLLLPKTKHLYYLESDQVGADWDLTGTNQLPTGVVKPSIGITARSAAVKTIRIAKIALTVTVN